MTNGDRRAHGITIEDTTEVRDAGPVVGRR
jgi:hypothetical protein